MSVRVRFLVALGVAMVVGSAFGWLTRDWNGVGWYAAFAGVIAVFALPAVVWVDLAPDGALRRRPGGRRGARA